MSSRSSVNKIVWKVKLSPSSLTLVVSFVRIRLAVCFFFLRRSNWISSSLIIRLSSKLSGIFLLLSAPHSHLFLSHLGEMVNGRKWKFLPFVLFMRGRRTLAEPFDTFFFLPLSRCEFSSFSTHFDYVSCSHTFHISRPDDRHHPLHIFLDRWRIVSEIFSTFSYDWWYSRRPDSTRWQWRKVFHLHKISNLHNTRIVCGLYRLSRSLAQPK